MSNASFLVAHSFRNGDTLMEVLKVPERIITYFDTAVMNLVFQKKQPKKGKSDLILFNT